MPSGRGLSVLLVEQSDLASATSSASTKLIHGGLRYLEYYEFRLVREALIEREVLLRTPRISSGRLPSCCRTRRRCDQPGSFASACSSTTIWAGASCCRARGKSISGASGRQAAQALLDRLQNIPTAGSTMRGWSFQRARCEGARRRDHTRTPAFPPARGTNLDRGHRECAKGERGRSAPAAS